MFLAEDLQRLRTELSAGRGLVLVRADSGSEREAMRTWLLENAPPPVVMLDVGSAEDPIGAIEAASRGAGTVVASADVVEPSLERWLQAMNTGRDGLRGIDAPVLLMVPNPVLDALAQRAPDLWSWRGGVYESVAEPVRSVAVREASPPPQGVGLERAWQLLQDDGAGMLVDGPLFVDPGRLGWGAATRRVATRMRLGGGLRTHVLVGTTGAGVRTAVRSLLRGGGGYRGLLSRVAEGPEADQLLRVSLVIARQLSASSRSVRDLAALVGRAEPGESFVDRVLSAASWTLPGVAGVSVPVIPARRTAAESPRSLESIVGGLRAATEALIHEFVNERAVHPLLAFDTHGASGDAVTAMLTALDGLAGAPFSAVVGLRAGVVNDEHALPGDVEVEQVDSVETGVAAGREFLRHLLARRGIDANTFEPAAIDLLVSSSGGLPGTLLALARDAALTAIEDGRTRVGEADVRGAGRRFARRLRFGLSPYQHEGLGRVGMGMPLEPDLRASLERAGALIRTHDGVVVHPVLIAPGVETSSTGAG